jgi:hypothetical protein
MEYLDFHMLLKLIEKNMSKETKDWMQRLVENYRIPSEEEQSNNSEQPKMLKESQLKKILERD